MNLIKRYKFFLVSLLMLIILFFINKDIGLKAVNVTGCQFKVMILVIPPIFILLGLLDVWVPRETMMKYMGEKSGVIGILLAILLGSAAAGPLYGAFPVAAVLMKKGVKFTNVLIFIGAWSTTKIPMFLFEMSSLGTKFAITRLLVDIPGIIIIAYILSHMISKEEIRKIYERVEVD
ncbi:Predicted permease [Caminicella sporogenes DSM 14501]|uniref:Predicted permease n=1 Tax=Caminicella sporogenes DSM 14501 TaxID=1121266 RepID=A0A1M6TY66_9FIRM|nr:permease [Caminicella sporogenes]RKD24764.1 permease [Caminicella sporogenes]SHK61879.1 Predicted permease [Caminicella sporogenes DSM 14501]